MKKLYFLNEEEKQRILRLHKSRQIGKTWLTEQHNEELDEASLATNVYDVGKGAAGGAAAGIGVGLAFGSIFPPLEIVSIPAGAIIGAIYGLVSTISSSMNRSEFNGIVEQACKKTGAGKPTLTGEKMIEIAQKLNDYINTPNLMGGGYATEASRQGIRETLLNAPSLPDMCYIMARYKQVFGISLLDDLDREIYWDKYYSEVVRYPLSLAIEKSLDITKKAEEEGETEVTDPKTGKKIKIKGKEGSTYTANDLTQPFVEVYPCFAGIATETKDKNIVYIMNPSSHLTIIDTTVGNGTKTTIAEKTFFKNDGTYYKSSDRNKVSGNFECGMGGEEIWLTPTSAGVGEPKSILTANPCLKEYNITHDGDDKTVGKMDDESRARHEQLSKYPKGEVYFFENGEFLTEFDDRRQITRTGTWKCVGRKKTTLVVTTAKPGAWDEPEKGLEPEYRYPDPERPKNRMSGMGIVSASSSYITEILKCAKIGGSTLDQTALNKLYDYIKNNK